jgi:hypothetical protein
VTSEGQTPPGERPRSSHSAPSAEAALARAGRHARNAASEALEAVRALLDAIAIVSGGAPAESHAALSGAAEWLDRLARQLASDSRETAVTRALAEALDAEIGRWEERAREDPDARAVLRAFLGVRELLWELGVRAAPKPASAAPSARKPKRASRKRVERVPVQG